MERTAGESSSPLRAAQEGTPITPIMKNAQFLARNSSGGILVIATGFMVQ